MAVIRAASRRLTIAVLASIGLLAGWWLVCGEAPEPTRPQEHATPDSPPVADLPEPPPTQDPGLPENCDALAELAREGGPDAVLLAWLCPSRPMDAITARAALLALRSPDEARTLVPRLADHPALHGLARLVAQPRVPPLVGFLPNPAHAVVSPVDDLGLARVQHAHALIAEPGIAIAERTRARAYVAKVYLQATQQLGVGVGRAPGPFGRLLAGRALHYGRSFCVAYWRNRVHGLAPLFGEIETRLLELVLALESGAPHGDAARLAVELEETRRYLAREGPRERIERRLAKRSGTPWGPERLQPLPNALERLIALGFVDLAIARALEAGQRPGGPGLRAVEQLLADDLARAEQGEYEALLERRFARAHGRTPPPPEPGLGVMEHAAEHPFIGATTLADEAASFIERAPPSGFSRGYALGRALLLVRTRPDALVKLLDRASDPSASPALQDAIPWLIEELVARDDGRRAWQERRVNAELIREPSDAPNHHAEAARRRSFALTLRQDDRFPRGRGMTERSG